VRGDPSLGSCLRGLLAQNYPRYDVRIVIDSGADPAGEVVRRAVAAHPAAAALVSCLERGRPTCSLKLSALIQAITALDDSFPVVALIDADVTPYPDWLRDLVGPLADPRVGAATGIRWFTPRAGRWGTRVRYLWGAAACTQMYAFCIPWGGSLALRADLLRDRGLLEQWKHSLWEDTAAYRALRERGLELRFVPAATMLNQETIGLGGLRLHPSQMLNIRLYHPAWRPVVAHGLASAVGPAAVTACLGLALAGGSWAAAAGRAGLLAAYALGLGCGLSVLEGRIGRLVRSRGESWAPLSRGVLLAVPLSHLVYLASLASARLLRRVAWRGITCEFHGPWDVRMVEYRPYGPARQAADRTASLV
jgi:hypothetical protein